MEVVLIRIHTLSKNKKIKIILLFIVILILLITLISISFQNIYNKYFYKDYYKIVDRTNKLKETQKEDTEKYKAVGWLKIQGTTIDTPIYELYRSIREEISIEGRNYVWIPANHDGLLNRETLIGHNILNLSSNPGAHEEEYSGLEDLMSFVYYEEAQKNKYIQYTYKGKTYLYKIFSVSLDDNYYLVNYETSEDYDEEKMKEIIEHYKDVSIYDYDVDVNENDKIVTVDTCTMFYGQNSNTTFTVTARLIRKEEKIGNYSVKKNKNYNKVEKKMKGEKENEEKENA